MSYKTIFIFGLLAAAAWTIPLTDQDLSEDKVLPSTDANAKVVLDFGDLKCDDDNVEKVEKVVETENGVSAIAKASFKIPMKKLVFGNFKCDDENVKQEQVDDQVVKTENVVPACVSVKKIDAEEMKKFMEEFNAKWEELKKQVEENKNTVKCENSEENKGDETVDNKKAKVFSFRVCSRVSAKASATATSRDCSNEEEAKPANGEKWVVGTNGDLVAVPDPVIADQPAAEPAVVETDKPVEADQPEPAVVEAEPAVVDAKQAVVDAEPAVVDAEPLIEVVLN